MTAPEPAILLQDVHKSFGTVAALTGLDLAVATGRITGLLGPNGAGKTTAIEICAGLQHADSGTVRVLGRDPWRQKAADRAAVGIMLQRGGVWAGASAEQAVRHVARFYADSWDPQALIDRLGLGSLGKTPFRRMSGGEQQRVKLACAMVGRPRLLVLDEPTAGLDPATRREVWTLVTELRRAGTTILLSTHAMEEAEHLSDHLVIIHRGACVASGTAADLTADPDSQTLRFRAGPHLDRTALLRALPPGFALDEDHPGSYRLSGAEIEPATVAAVTAWCAQHGVLASELSVQQRNLEQVFLDVTAEEVAR
ncbi:MAG: ABC transporter ATP-binding protein [Candidatus Nanopelagicales bacterium]